MHVSLCKSSPSYLKDLTIHECWNPWRPSSPWIQRIRCWVSGGIKGLWLKQIWISWPLCTTWEGINVCGRLWGWRCPKALLFLFRFFNSSVWYSQLLLPSYRSGNWRTNRLGLFPKVTLTANEKVGERAQHSLRAVISALGGTAHGRKGVGAQGLRGTERPCLLCGLLISSWQVGCTSVQPFASGIQCTNASPATADLGITLVTV